MSSDKPRGQTFGASRAAVQSHYDVSTDFYRLWLDSSMTYSCALWRGAKSLERAQQRKLDFHVGQACAAGRDRVLDVGCGWGSLLRRLVVKHRVKEAVGLTLSQSQADYVHELKLTGARALLESWTEHQPSLPYDAIISIGAMEHFVRPEMSRTERVGAYREFFRSCHLWLKPNSWMSLQTIAYGIGHFSHGAISSIFPESDLPRATEIIEASEGFFEVVSIQNDRMDYARTCREWLSRLVAGFEDAQKLVGDQTVRHFRAFLDAAARGFEARVFLLLRIRLQRITRLP